MDLVVNTAHQEHYYITIKESRVEIKKKGRYLPGTNADSR